MFVGLVLSTVALALIAVSSAATKLRKAEQVVTAIHGTVGVPMRLLPVFAALESPALSAS